MTWGVGGRRFKSSHADQKDNKNQPFTVGFLLANFFGEEQGKKRRLPTLRKAGIRYRNPYQTRHTFATQMISRGANLFWLASQMGHKGPEMLFRHYV